eukprot:scaffold1638_cov258-Pinguiococcus_pyrenoidosus.AAC.52
MQTRPAEDLDRWKLGGQRLQDLLRTGLELTRPRRWAANRSYRRGRERPPRPAQCKDRETSPRQEDGPLVPSAAPPPFPSRTCEYAAVSSLPDHASWHEGFPSPSGGCHDNVRAALSQNGSDGAQGSAGGRHQQATERDIRLDHLAEPPADAVNLLGELGGRRQDQQPRRALAGILALGLQAPLHQGSQIRKGLARAGLLRDHRVAPLQQRCEAQRLDAGRSLNAKRSESADDLGRGPQLRKAFHREKVLTARRLFQLLGCHREVLRVFGGRTRGPGVAEGGVFPPHAVFKARTVAFGPKGQQATSHLMPGDDEGSQKQRTRDKQDDAQGTRHRTETRSPNSSLYRKHPPTKQARQSMPA